MTIHNNVDQTFGFSTFYVFLDFLTQKQEMIDKKKKVKTFKKQMQTNKHNFSNQASITTKQSHKT